MEMQVVIFVCIALNLLGVLGSAFYWSRKPKLRKMTIVVTILSGCIYSFSNPLIVGVLEITKVIGISVLIGFGFYFTIWIQCKD